MLAKPAPSHPPRDLGSSVAFGPPGRETAAYTRIPLAARDLLIGASLANVTLLRVWSELLTSGAGDGYIMRHPPRPVDLLAAMGNVLALAVLFAGAAAAARRLGRPQWSQWALLLYLPVPLNALRAVVSHRWPGLDGAAAWHSGWRGVLLGSILLCALFSLARSNWRLTLTRWIAAALTAASPLLLLTFVQAGVRIARFDPAPFYDGPPATPISTHTPARRVIWLIFDELDQRLAFAERLPGVSLPEFDDFRAKSFTAARASSPGTTTLESMPALILGRPVERVRQAGPSDLQLAFGDGTAASWRSLENVFLRARASGVDSGLSGWYHPYCRVLNASLTECSWAEYSNNYNSTGDVAADVVANQLRAAVETNTLSPFGQTVVTRHQVGVYRTVFERTLLMVTNPRLGLVLAHLPFPHAPYIYNAATGQLDLRNAGVGAYADALQLADRSLGELRRAMQTAGLWDNATVLITADHGYRGDEFGRATARWVPFMVKFAGQEQPYTYDAPWETVRTADFLLDVLNGKLTTAPDAAAWLDHSRPSSSAQAIAK